MSNTQNPKDTKDMLVQNEIQHIPDKNDRITKEFVKSVYVEKLLEKYCYKR